MAQEVLLQPSPQAIQFEASYAAVNPSETTLPYPANIPTAIDEHSRPLKNEHQTPFLTTIDECHRDKRQHHLETPVRIGLYKYSGNVFYGEIKLQNLAYRKEVSIVYRDLSGSFDNICPAHYGHGPFQSNFETWKFSCIIPKDAGITQFYAKYVTDGKTYYDSNNAYNYNVTLSPGLEASKGFQKDITKFFKKNVNRAKKSMLANIGPEGASKGAVVAAPRNQSRNQNYFFAWVRDAALTMDGCDLKQILSKANQILVVNELYIRGDDDLEEILWDHAAFTHKIQNAGGETGIGEPKFEADGSAYTSPWCRPQNDGPGFRASLFIRFAKAYLEKGGDISKVHKLYRTVVQPDLLYILQNFKSSHTCDVWEEIVGTHFFTVMAMRRAFKEAVPFSRFLNDTLSASLYAAAATEIDAIAAQHWDAGFGTIRSTLNGRQLDAAIALGVNHGYDGDGLFAPNDDKVLNTLYRFALGNEHEFRISRDVQLDDAGRVLGVAIGRYYGDTYDGVATDSMGNPWYLAVSAFAELYYKAARLFIDSNRIEITPLNLPFFSGPRPAGLAVENLGMGATLTKNDALFEDIIESLLAVADSYMRRCKHFALEGFRLPEQFHRDCGDAQGVDDLTWSYASVLTSWFAREEVREVWE
ncbi:glycoside hydrolase 15 protein [Phlyctochytrium planicorne]|nr:glycoside hydrolase 15 protein [Phlyctochytrium planicorne]